METDILVVGGGLAGLSLASQLHQSGSDYRLIEMQDRLGGRILTAELSGGSFDLGPAWFWPGQPRMAALVKRFGIQVFEQYAAGDLVFQDQTGAVQRGRGFASMQGSYRVAGGMEMLTRALAQSLTADALIVGAGLTTLVQTQDGVLATLSDGRTLRASKVVLAIPPRVVAQTIAFDPPLSSAQMRRMQDIPTWMAGQAKIIATYDKPYWRNAGLSGDAMSQHGPMVEIHDASLVSGGPYALFGFVGVPADIRETRKSDVMQMAVDQLAALFGNELKSPLDVVIQDWATLPMIARPADRAALRSHPSYGLPASLRNLWEGALHLSSTETAVGFGGYLEGALEAAEQTANLLVQPAAAP